MNKTPMQIVKEKRTCPHCNKEFIKLDRHKCKLSPEYLDALIESEEPLAHTGKDQEIEVRESFTQLPLPDQIHANVEGMLPQMTQILEFMENCKAIFVDVRQKLINLEANQIANSLAHETFFEEWDVAKSLLVELSNIPSHVNGKNKSEASFEIRDEAPPAMTTADKIETKGTDTQEGKYIEVEATIDGETDKALRLKIDNEGFWFPKSTIHSKYEKKDTVQTFSCDKWILKNHGLVNE